MHAVLPQIESVSREFTCGKKILWKGPRTITSSVRGTPSVLQLYHLREVLAVVGSQRVRSLLWFVLLIVWLSAADGKLISLFETTNDLTQYPRDKVTSGMLAGTVVSTFKSDGMGNALFLIHAQSSYTSYFSVLRSICVASTRIYARTRVVIRGLRATAMRDASRLVCRVLGLLLPCALQFYFLRYRLIHHIFSFGPGTCLTLVPSDVPASNIIDMFARSAIFIRFSQRNPSYNCDCEHLSLILYHDVVAAIPRRH
ncbi:hypothetical protein IW262DRAFT_1371557 [Armillaria fumosa]|nr:hypothetical protein IW262DRAFT_1371557 [Armillaria fumosa]